MISLIFPVKDRLQHLQECIPTWLNQTYQDLEIIIVDYNCPQKSGEWVRNHHPVCKVVRALVQKQRWNLCASRNLGIRFSSGDIIGIFDADTIMAPTFIEDCMKKLTEDSFLCGYPIGKAHGCCVVHRKHLYTVDGYNEFLEGWGFDDQELYNKLTNGKYHDKNPILKYLDLQMKGFDENLIDLIRHEDQLRVKYQRFKTIKDSNHNNSHIALHSRRFAGLKDEMVKGVWL